MIAFSVSGNGTPVIFLHGFLGNRKNLKHLSDILDKERYKVYLLDMPSHGQSSYIPALDYDKINVALLHFFEQNEIDQAILVGHSMGAKAALSFTLTYPKKVLGLMTLDACLADNSAKLQNLLRAIEKLDLSWSFKQVRTYLEEGLDDDRSLVSFILLNLKATQQGFMWTKDLKSLLTDNISVWEEVKLPKPCYPFEKPVTCIYGENSSFCVKTDRSRMNTYFPNAQTIVLEKVGHFPHLEKPIVCANLLKELLEQSKIYPYLTPTFSVK